MRCRPEMLTRRPTLEVETSFQLRRAEMRHAQGILVDLGDEAGVFQAGRGGQQLAVAPPDRLQFRVGRLDVLRGRVGLQIDEVLLVELDRQVQDAARRVGQDVLAELAIRLGHALGQHAHAAGLVDRLVEAGDGGEGRPARRGGHRERDHAVAQELSASDGRHSGLSVVGIRPVGATRTLPHLPSRRTATMAAGSRQSR
jgi:hypothetical protein